MLECFFPKIKIDTCMFIKWHEILKTYLNYSMISLRCKVPKEKVGEGHRNKDEETSFFQEEQLNIL